MNDKLAITELIGRRVVSQELTAHLARFSMVDIPGVEVKAVNPILGYTTKAWARIFCSDGLSSPTEQMLALRSASLIDNRPTLSNLITAMRAANTIDDDLSKAAITVPFVTATATQPNRGDPFNVGIRVGDQASDYYPSCFQIVGEKAAFHEVSRHVAPRQRSAHYDEPTPLHALRVGQVRFSEGMTQDKVAAVMQTIVESFRPLQETLITLELIEPLTVAA